MAALSALAVSAACSSEPPAPVPGSTDGALKDMLKSYAVEFLRRNPTTNTYLGGAGLDPSLVEVDGMLRDFSTTALGDEDQWLSEQSGAIARVPPDTLSPSARIDREVALAQIQFMLRQHQTRKYQERALDTYVSEPFRAIDWQLQGMSQTGDQTYGTAAEWTLVVNRVRTIPRYLATAQAQLEIGVKNDRVPDRRMLERDGLDATAANARYFGETLLALAAKRMSGPDKERLTIELQDATRLAAQAYRDFRTFIASTFFEANSRRAKPAFAADRYALGEEEYNWATANNLHIDVPAARLFDEAWPIVQATQAQMVELARRIGAEQSWTLAADGTSAVRAVFDQLSKDYPKNDDEMVAWYRDAAFRLVDYSRKTGVFDVPADYKLDVVLTPPPLEASIDGAAYYPAPPFRKTGVGRYYVTPTHNDLESLKSNNRASLAYLSAHEGFPGHDWYFKVLTQAKDTVSPVRWLTPGSVEDSSSMWQDSMPAEGWGLYAEALMAEPQPGGPPDGFYSPSEHLYQLQGKLFRDLRVRIDTGIHTGRMSYDDAVTLFSEVVDFLPGSCAATAKQSPAKRASCSAAERAIFRYSKWPVQAITYRLGKDQIYALREEAARRLGTKFSARAFHLAFIRQGTIPSGYFRDVLLDELGK